MHRAERAESRKKACSSGRHRREQCSNNMAKSRRTKHPRFGDRRQEQQQAHARRPSHQRPYLILHNEQASVNVSTKKKNKACRSKASSPPSPAAPSFIQSSPPVTSQPTALSSSSAVSQTVLAQCPSLIP